MPARAAFAAFLSDRVVDARVDEPLALHTTLRIGGTADWFVRPRDERELADILRAARECDVPWRILGSGANILVGDAGVCGVVLHLGRMRRRDGTQVQAGYSLSQLVKETVAEGVSGLEFLAGVPASIGGAIVMNAGGRYGEIAQSVRAVDVVTPEGDVRRLSRGEVPFRYRSWGLAPGHIALAAGFQWTPDPGTRARYDAVLAQKKATQPLGSPNAGCVFKNPPGRHAGRLIDEAGLKGARSGRAHVSRKHANFIINEGKAIAADVHRLIDLVRARVNERFEVDLELEILTW
ncbi:MAG: UDP-N-acetylmuramate dehydrogenase [Planctomycetes bacterium]|nr:UDP-N-acetylmuramate dehydrogenase [Planctomycetota bacterium]